MKLRERAYIRTHLSTHIRPFPRLQTCLGFLLLLPLLLVVYQIRPSNVVELQQHSPLSNNTSVTTYVHRMIISLICLFKHMKNDDRVAMISSAFLVIHSKNCISDSFRCCEITFQRGYTTI